MEGINFFNSIGHLEPHCPTCDSKIEYGITTTFNEGKEGHMCNSCQTLLD